MKKPEFHYLTYEASTTRAGITNVHGWKPYPFSSVLYGQMAKCFIDSFPSVEEAVEAYPEATPSHSFIQPTLSLDHLPGEDDGGW